MVEPELLDSDIIRNRYTCRLGKNPPMINVGEFTALLDIAVLVGTADMKIV